MLIYYCPYAGGGIGITLAAPPPSIPVNPPILFA